MSVPTVLAFFQWESDRHPDLEINAKDDWLEIVHLSNFGIHGSEPKQKIIRIPFSIQRQLYDVLKARFQGEAS